MFISSPQRQSLLQQLERNEREMAATAMELDLYLQGRKNRMLPSPFALSFQSVPRLILASAWMLAWMGMARRQLDGLLPFATVLLH